jgi:hypothetical protein
MEALMAMGAVDASTSQDLQNHILNMGALALSSIVGIISIVSLLGILCMTLVVAPNATQRISCALRERNILSFFAGVPIMGFFGLTTAIVHKSQALVAVNFLILGVVMILAYAAAAEDIGRRLFWACGKEGSRVSHLASVRVHPGKRRPPAGEPTRRGRGCRTREPRRRAPSTATPTRWRESPRIRRLHSARGSRLRNRPHPRAAPTQVSQARARVQRAMARAALPEKSPQQGAPRRAFDARSFHAPVAPALPARKAARLALAPPQPAPPHAQAPR